MARVDLREGLESSSVRALRRLLGTGRVWVKLSGADRLACSPPRMDDSAALARLLVEDAPERTVWGTDFPHPDTHGFMPDDGDLTDLLPRTAPGPEGLRRLLVDNPARCFGCAAETAALRGARAQARAQAQAQANAHARRRRKRLSADPCSRCRT